MYGWRASHWTPRDWFPHLPAEVCTLYYSSCWNLSDIIYVKYEILWAVLRTIPHSTNIYFVLMGQGLSIWETAVGQGQKSCTHMHTHTNTQACTHIHTQACTHNHRSSWSLHLKKQVYLFGCGTKDLPSSWQHVGSSVAACGRTQFPDQELNSAPSWENGVFATGPTGRSQSSHFIANTQ